MDATFASTKKGARHRPDRSGKGTKIVALPCGDGLLLAVTVGSASPAEYRLVESVLTGKFLDELPAQLIGDKAYNSDRFDEALVTEYGMASS